VAQKGRARSRGVRGSSAAAKGCGERGGCRGAAVERCYGGAGGARGAEGCGEVAVQEEDEAPATRKKMRGVRPRGRSRAPAVRKKGHQPRGRRGGRGHEEKRGAGREEEEQGLQARGRGGMPAVRKKMGQDGAPATRKTGSLTLVPYE
jgi:hypothetical protein